jgi:hypothetical protein
MKRGISALASAALLGGSLFLGGGAAQAAGCPAGSHWNDMGNGAGWCAQDPSGGGTGGNTVYNGGGSPQAPAPAPIQVPVYKDPVWTPPANNIPPMYSGPAPQAPALNAPKAPTNAAPKAPTNPAPQQQAPARTAPGAGGTNRAPAAGQPSVYTAPGGQAVAKNTQGIWVDPSTGIAADAGVAAEAEQATADPAAEAQQKAEQEAQAAQALQAAKVASVAKAADTAIVKRQIEAALNKALDNR